MYLIRLGGRVISLEHLISVVDEDEESGPPPGGATVTLERGQAFHVDHALRALLYRHIDEFLMPDPAVVAQASTARAVRLDPSTGQPLPGSKEGHKSS